MRPSRPATTAKITNTQSPAKPKNKVARIGPASARRTREGRRGANTTHSGLRECPLPGKGVYRLLLRSPGLSHPSSFMGTKKHIVVSSKTSCASSNIPVPHTRHVPLCHPPPPPPARPSRRTRPNANPVAGPTVIVNRPVIGSSIPRYRIQCRYTRNTVSRVRPGG